MDQEEGWRRGEACWQTPRGEELAERLYEWAFGQEPEIPSADEMSPDEPARLLDAAAAACGIAGTDEWLLAAVYFEAENFHGLVSEAARRGGVTG